MRITCLLILFVLTSTWPNAQTILYSESFETDGEGTRYFTNTYSFCTGVPGNNPDYFLRTNTNPVLPAGCTSGFGNALTNLQGSWFWAGEDIRSSTPVPNIQPPGDITTQPINITGHVALSVSLYLATANNNNLRWETSDSINIQVSINNGTYFTVGRFVGDNLTGGRLRIDANLDGIGEGAAVDVSNFTQYSFSIPGTGTTMRVKLDFDQAGGTEEMGIDLIEVRGISVVPLTLLQFNATLQDGKAVMNWLTVNEQNCDRFEIQRSGDALLFETIGNVTALNISTEIHYSFTDNLPLKSTGYYRLRMIDKDGSYSFSAIIRIINSIEENRLIVYPNPAKDILNISSNKKEVVVITGISGRILWQGILQAGNNPVPVGNLPAGIYLIRTGSGQTIKWIK
jgi:hypothetical protein